jgi:hypothetical protein
MRALTQIPPASPQLCRKDVSGNITPLPKGANLSTCTSNLYREKQEDILNLNFTPGIHQGNLGRQLGHLHSQRLIAPTKSYFDHLPGLVTDVTLRHALAAQPSSQPSSKRYGSAITFSIDG